MDCPPPERLENSPVPRRLGGKPAGLHVGWEERNLHSPSSLSSFHLPNILSPERDSWVPWQGPGLGGRRLGFGHGQSITYCVTLDSHFTSLGLFLCVRYIRLPETFSSGYWGRRSYLKPDVPFPYFYRSCLLSAQPEGSCLRPTEKFLFLTSTQKVNRNGGWGCRMTMGQDAGEKTVRKVPGQPLPVQCVRAQREFSQLADWEVLIPPLGNAPLEYRALHPIHQGVVH